MESNGQRIGRLLKEQYNLDISRYDESFLEKTIRNIMHDSGFQTVDDYSNQLRGNHGLAGALHQSLGISYSEFFRNSLTFGVLEHLILPDLVQKKTKSGNNEIRIWSVASAAGQEAYSIAMLLEELKNGDNARFTYRIFASDISETQIAHAQSGIFIPTAMKQLTMRRVERWFDQVGDHFVIKPQLQKHIDFSVFDIFTDSMHCPPASIFGDFDMVFCANILFYYTKDWQQAIMQKLEKCLSANGYIITGEVERDMLLHFGYKSIFPNAPIFQHKQP